MVVHFGRTFVPCLQAGRAPDARALFEHFWGGLQLCRKHVAQWVSSMLRAPVRIVESKALPMSSLSAGILRAHKLAGVLACGASPPGPLALSDMVGVFATLYEERYAEAVDAEERLIVAVARGGGVSCRNSLSEDGQEGYTSGLSA